jgi:group II intron reverse transcriptase/maturase
MAKGNSWFSLIELKENVRDIMRNPEMTLNSLVRHSNILTYKFQRLYRILFNEEMYYIAYQKIYSKAGNMTPGSDGKTIDGMSVSRVKHLIESLKDESYQPVPSKRIYIPKKNGSKRPLGIPTFTDKLLQEVIRMILETIYEGHFENSSHGFRPSRSCHTALKSAQKTFTGAKWFIEGDIKGFFDNIDHEVLINIMKERIEDERFIRLIRKLLKAGYIEDWTYHRTYSGTPQGGIISPIMANIYLDKFDKYIKEYTQEFDKGTWRKPSKESRYLVCKKYRLSQKLKVEKDEVKRKLLLEQINDIVKERQKHPASVQMDENMRKLKYVRYADDFLIGVIGSKEDCTKIKEDLKDFLRDKLKLELSEDKTLITHAEKPAKFLGYEIFIRKSNGTKKDKMGYPRRCFSSKVVLYVSTEVIRKKLLDYKAMKIIKPKEKEVWRGISRGYMIAFDDLEIISQYNAEIRGFYNYYSIANNSHIINSFYYIMCYSMYSTYASKHRSSINKLMNKHRKNGVFSIPYTDRKGNIKYRILYNEGFKRKMVTGNSSFDNIPMTVTITGGRNSLTDRLMAKTCEYCGANDEIEMHHVRKLKDLKGKTNWEKQMIGRRRKTLAVCISCHEKLHAGTLD